MTKNKDNSKIEMRSENIRHILDKIPGHPTLVLTLISLLIIIMVFIVAACVDYPYGQGESILKHFLKI